MTGMNYMDDLRRTVANPEIVLSSGSTSIKRDARNTAFSETSIPRGATRGCVFEAEEMNAVDGALLRERSSRFLGNDSQKGKGEGNYQYGGLSTAPDDETIMLRSR